MNNPELLAEARDKNEKLVRELASANAEIFRLDTALRELRIGATAAMSRLKVAAAEAAKEEKQSHERVRGDSA